MSSLLWQLVCINSFSEGETQTGAPLGLKMGVFSPKGAPVCFSVCPVKGENRTRLRWPRNSRQQLEKNCFESPVVFHPISVMVGTSHILSKPVFALPVKSRAYRKHFPHSIVVGGAWEIKVKCFVQCPLKWKAELLFVVFNLPRRKPQGRIRCTQD